jgi:hypothetical protein
LEISRCPKKAREMKVKRRISGCMLRAKPMPVPSGKFRTEMTEIKQPESMSWIGSKIATELIRLGGSSLVIARGRMAKMRMEM